VREKEPDKEPEKSGKTGDRWGGAKGPQTQGEAALSNTAAKKLWLKKKKNSNSTKKQRKRRKRNRGTWKEIGAAKNWGALGGWTARKFQEAKTKRVEKETKKGEGGKKTHMGGTRRCG